MAAGRPIVLVSLFFILLGNYGLPKHRLSYITTLDQFYLPEVICQPTRYEAFVNLKATSFKPKNWQQTRSNYYRLSDL